MCTTNDKPFLTYNQQIQKLSAKGLIVGDFNNAVNLLKKHSYFALISGYKSPFKSKKTAPMNLIQVWMTSILSIYLMMPSGL